MLDKLKELFRSRLGKLAVKTIIWSVVGFAIGAAGNGLLMLVMDKWDRYISGELFGFLYGTFYCLLFASYYLFLGSVITLFVMIIAKYSKRRFCKKIN